MSQPPPRQPVATGAAPLSVDVEARRQDALAYLRRHVHDGDLTLEEYGIRVERVLLASTPAEVLASVDGLPSLPDPVTAGWIPPVMPLPADAGGWSPSREASRQASGFRVDTSSSARSRTVFGIFSEAKLKGRWRGGRSVSVLSLFGGATIDLREAVLSEDELVITGLVAFGSLQIIVPPGADLDVNSLVIFGSRREDDDDADPLPGMPRINVNVTVLFGDVRIKVRGAESSKRRRRK